MQISVNKKLVTRDYKIRNGDAVENHFMLKNSNRRIALKVFFENGIKYFSIEIHADNGSIEQSWGFVSGVFTARYLFGLIKNPMRDFDELVTKNIFSKYSDENFRVGVTG